MAQKYQKQMGQFGFHHLFYECSCHIASTTPIASPYDKNCFLHHYCDEGTYPHPPLLVTHILTVLVPCTLTLATAIVLF